MKFLLTLVICSGLEGVGCIPPHVWPDKFDNLYLDAARMVQNRQITKTEIDKFQPDDDGIDF